MNRIMTAEPSSSEESTAGAVRDAEAAVRRVATVDVGTNSIRLLVAEAQPDGGYRLLDDEKVVGGLGRGMTQSSRLDPEVMKESARTIAHMKSIAEGYGVEMFRAVATWAVRKAENRDEFLEEVRRQAGLELEVIGGEEEARLAYLSVKSAFDLRGREIAVVDIGGGSTEVVTCTGGIVEKIHSMDLGAVRLTETLDLIKATPEVRLARLRKLVAREIKANVDRPTASTQLVIGTGGTFTALAHLLIRATQAGEESDDRPPISVRGYEVKLADVRRLLERLARMTPRQRAELPGLSPDRAKIIVAGIAIIAGIMKRLGANTLQVHDRGIRDGVLIAMTHEIFPEAATLAVRPPDRLRSVRAFARSCRYEERHAEHVTGLALQVYDQFLESLPDLPEVVRNDSARALLEASGVLHDVGYYINYSRHHKHSYHLILHSELAGFSHRELELVANIARYHRRAHPKPSHANYKRLTPVEQDLVVHLAAILRVADGLDRAHAGNVRRVRTEIDALTAWFIVDAERKPEVDLWGAARKSRLFLKVFSREPRFHWAGEPAPEAEPR